MKKFKMEWPVEKWPIEKRPVEKWPVEKWPIEKWPIENQLKNGLLKNGLLKNDQLKNGQLKKEKKKKKYDWTEKEVSLCSDIRCTASRRRVGLAGAIRRRSSAFPSGTCSHRVSKGPPEHWQRPHRPLCRCVGDSPEQQTQFPLQKTEKKINLRGGRGGNISSKPLNAVNRRKIQFGRKIITNGALSAAVGRRLTVRVLIRARQGGTG